MMLDLRTGQSLRMVVVSTGFRPMRSHLCLESVRRQEGVEIEHRWVDADKQAPARPALQNLLELTRDLAPEDVVVSLDLDDWLAREDALAVVYEAHRDGAWVTYGSYCTADGRPGLSAATHVGSCRAAPWTASHLKSYRAGLLHRIRHADLQDTAGEWLRNARDVAVMLPVLEMAGQERSAFIDQILMIYNAAESFEANNGLAGLAQEREALAYVRGLTPYARAEKLGPQGAPFDERSTGGVS
jgi:hypothetical protein